MTSVKTQDDFENQLKTFVNAAVAIHKAGPWHMPLSIEYGGGDSLFLTFVLNKWNEKEAKWIEPICDLTGLEYHIAPINDKLVVTLS